jgi:hypothetical protein
MSAAPWAELLPELVREIARRFADPEDRAWMRAVCKKWHAADPDFRLPEPVRRALLPGHARAAARQWLTLCDGRLFRLMEEAKLTFQLEVLFDEIPSWTISSEHYIVYVSIRRKTGDLLFCSLWSNGSNDFICAFTPEPCATLATWFEKWTPEFIASLTPQPALEKKRFYCVSSAHLH